MINFIDWIGFVGFPRGFVLSLTLSASANVEAVIVYISYKYRVWRFRSSVMLCCVYGRVVPDVSKGRFVFIFRVKESKYIYFYFTILRNVRNIRRTTQRRIPEDVKTLVTLVYNSQNCIKLSKNKVYCIVLISFIMSVCNTYLTPYTGCDPQYAVMLSWVKLSVLLRLNY